VQIVIYRLVQEALTNVGKHAGASEIKVWGRIDNQQFRLCIVDDGQGFDFSEVEENVNKGLGLTTMQERLYIINGSFEIESQKGQGAKLHFSIPVLPKAA
jgi:signal transduction histidine kinase